VPNYEIYLSYNNQEEGFIVPVNPEDIQVNLNGNSKTYDIVGKGGGASETRAGEVNVIKNPKLMEITFSSIFPAQRYPSVVTEYLFDPIQYINYIRKWMATKHPIRFIFVGNYTDKNSDKGSQGNDINIAASIEKFTWKEIGGAPGDIEYSITLKEYVFYSARKIEVKTDSAGKIILNQTPPLRYDDRIRPDTYTMKERETLALVAMKFFTTDTGRPDSSRWKDIQTLNNITDAQMKGSLAGTVLKIPPY
jgi:hypothetical protein